MALDHGVLNIPGRTNNINAELDRYKAQQQRKTAAAHKASRAAHKELVAQAKAIVNGWTLERFAELGKPHGLTAKQAHKQMLSAASMRPEHILRANAQ